MVDSSVDQFFAKPLLLIKIHFDLGDPSIIGGGRSQAYLTTCLSIHNLTREKPMPGKPLCDLLSRTPQRKVLLRIPTESAKQGATGEHPVQLWNNEPTGSYEHTQSTQSKSPEMDPRPGSIYHIRDHDVDFLC
jgi:hypothetical protein